MVLIYHTKYILYQTENYPSRQKIHQKSICQLTCAVYVDAFQAAGWRFNSSEIRCVDILCILHISLFETKLNAKNKNKIKKQKQTNRKEPKK